MNPVIDHIQITVKDLVRSEKFYDKLMPVLGFDINQKSIGKVEAHDFDVIEYFHPNFTFGINSPRKAFTDDAVHRRKPGALHHLAFKAESNNEVDRLYRKIKDIGAQIVDSPRYYPQHGTKYYALFFKDLDGIKFEVVCEDYK